MLYSKQQLETLATKEEKSIASKRYLYKVHNGDVKKLWPHECEFVSSFLPSIFTEKDLKTPAYNIYELSYCAEPLFKRLILTYLDNLDFLMPAFNGIKYLNATEIAKDKTKFDELLQSWILKLKPDFSGPFLHEVKIEYNRKLKILEEQFKQGLYGRRMYDRKIQEQQIACFYIYYITKTFFRSNKSNYVSFQSHNSIFSVNTYSYVHIISRHYIPKLNGIDSEKSFNTELTCIDPFNLPFSLRDFILDYLNNAPANYSLHPEYMIFSEGNEFYIIWWKKKPLEELSLQTGYEIRTLYKIEAERDKQKINHNNFYQKSDRIKYFY
ncbi:hypothetical protein [Pedobacter nototheniae]|uniref:hypothetical protein n=1 Tax=Pedobacter nototheniae TaxID=2488994 RepID=UPI00292E0D52|nr:hypothetical protein [Pedobacter nototheniae]